MLGLWSAAQRRHPGAIQPAVAKHPLTSDFAPQCMGRWRGNRAHNRPISSRWLELDGDSNASSLSLSNALYRTSSTTRFIPPSRHLSLPSKNAYRELFCISSLYFVFSLKEKKKSWRQDAVTWVRVSHELHTSKKQIFSKLFCPKCPSVIYFLKFVLWGRENPGNIGNLKLLQCKANGAAAERLGNGAFGVLPAFPALPLSAHLQLRARYFLLVAHSYIL